MRRGPDPAFPLAFTGISHPELRHHYPEYRSLSQSRIRAQILANPAFPVAVKYRIPLTFPESRTLLWPNPGSREHGTFSFLLMITWQTPPHIMFFKLLCNSMAKFRP